MTRKRLECYAAYAWAGLVGVVAPAVLVYNGTGSVWAAIATAVVLAGLGAGLLEKARTDPF